MERSKTIKIACNICALRYGVDGTPTFDRQEAFEEHLLIEHGMEIEDVN